MNALTGAGHDPYDCTSQDCAVDFTEHLNDSIEGKRVGIIPAFMEAEGLTPEVKAAVQRAAQELQNQGAELVEVDLPHLDAAIAAYYVIGPAEAFSNLARFDGIRYGYQEEGCANLSDQSSLSRAHGFGAEAKRRQMLGAYLLQLGRVRQVLLRRAKGPHAHHAGLRCRVCQGGHHPHARLAAHGL